MKAILTMVGLAIFSVQSFAQAKIYIPEMIHSFDTLQQGDRCEHDFMVINIGDLPLIFSNVKTSCGCDAPSWDKQPVLPGDTTYVNYKYDSKRIGRINKTMTMSSNDPESPTIVVRVKGIILPKED